MTFRRLLIGSILFLSVLFLGVQDASACSCSPMPTVLDAYDHAPVIATMRVNSVVKVTSEGGAERTLSAKLAVMTVYKGDIRPGDELTFVQGGNSCAWNFSERNVGEEYLLYLQPPQKKGDSWYAGGCGRSRGLARAGDDLLFLNNLEQARGRSRVSGTLSFSDDDEARRAGIKIRITDGKRNWDLKTDPNGVYELYDLPAGNYFVQLDPIKGWKIDRYSLDRQSNPTPATSGPTAPGIPLTIIAKKHTALDVGFDIDNAIRGQVVDPNGNPMKDVCINAIDPDPKVKNGYNFDCTDVDGTFTIDELPRGSYLLILNKDGRIDANEPFRTFYYPNVTDRAKATVLFIGPGEFIDGVNITVPEVMETITVQGLFLYADGNPVVGERVEFQAGPAGSDDVNVAAIGDVGENTDKNGWFSFKLLKGSTGILYGSMMTYSGEFKNCPALEKLIKASGKEIPTLLTPVLAVPGDRDLFDIVVKLPFSRCEKADDDDDEDDED